MTKKDGLVIIAVALAIVGVAWALIEVAKRKELEGELAKKNKDYLALLSAFLDGKKDIPKEIKDQLIHLRNEYSAMNPNVAKKLQVVIELIADNKEEIAIEKLTLIIENLLKEKYIAEGKAKDKKSCPSLFKLLEYARDSKWFNKHHFSFSLFLKDNRNEEAHELTANFSDNDKMISFLAGINIIYQLNGIKRIG